MVLTNFPLAIAFLWKNTVFYKNKFLEKYDSQHTTTEYYVKNFRKFILLKIVQEHSFWSYYDDDAPMRHIYPKMSKISILTIFH